VKLIYLDAVGLLASLANRILLRSPMPTRRQIAVWDRMMIRASRAIDPGRGPGHGGIRPRRVAETSGWVAVLVPLQPNEPAVAEPIWLPARVGPG
jgi:hypothetical protein